MITNPNDRRDEMPINRGGHAQPFRTEGEITHGIIHITAVDGNTADQHFRFHTNPKAKNASGLYTGRGWRNGAYTSYIGKDGRRELLLDYEVVGNHCGNWDMNRNALALVVEGQYHIEPFPEELIQPVVDECLWHEAKLGRRLIWTWHDVVKPGWKCPGKYFPKEEVLRRIDAHYEAGGEQVTDDKELLDDPVTPIEPDTSRPEVVEPHDPAKQIDGGLIAVIILILSLLGTAIASIW